MARYPKLTTFAVSLLLLLSPRPARPASSGIGLVGGPVRAIATSNGNVYAGAGARLLIFSPDATSASGFALADASDPLSDLVRGIAVRNGRAFVAAGAAGLLIYDVSRAGKPVLLSSLTIPGYAEGVAVTGNVALVAAGPLGLRLVDVSNPAHPVESGYLFEGTYATAVAVRDRYALVAAGGAGLLVVDISAPAAPKAVASLQTPGYAAGITIAGDYAFTMNSWEGISSVNLADPKQPVLASTSTTPGWAVKGAVSGTTLAVADAYGGVRLLDISDPVHPVETGADEPRFGEAEDAAFDGGRVFVADYRLGVRAVDVASAKSSAVYSSFPGGWSLAISGNYAYVAAQRSGVQVLDISDPARPVQIGSYPVTFAVGVAVNGSYVYVSAGQNFDDSGFYVLDVSDPRNPQRVGFLFADDLWVQTGQWNPRNLTCAGAICYVANDCGLWIVDASDPAHPAVAGSIQLPPSAPVVESAVRGSLLYLAHQGLGLVIFDVSNPAAPVQVGQESHCGFAKDVDLSGNYAIVAGTGNSCVIDVSDPANPRVTANGLQPGRGVTVVGSRAYLATLGFGIQVVDLSNASAPAVAGQYRTAGYARKALVRDDRLWIMDVDAGVWSVPLSGSVSASASAPAVPFSHEPGVLPGRPAWPMGGRAHLAVPVLPPGGGAEMAGRPRRGHGGGRQGRGREASAGCVVSSRADSGDNSLRNCLAALDQGGAITFAATVFPPDSPGRIRLLSPLPPITQGGISIDASNAGVILDGASLAKTDVGLTVVSDANTIRGLEFKNFRTAVMVSGGAKDNTIGGDRTAGSGPDGAGNSFRQCGNGIVVSGQGTTGNVVMGNYLSVAQDGVHASGWGFERPPVVQACVLIGAGAQGNRVGGTQPGERNVFGQCGWPGGLTITGAGTTDNVVIGNYIGLNPAGTDRFLCWDDEYCRTQGQVMIGGGASRNRIGGLGPGERNVISGAGNAGIDVGGFDTVDNVIIGNYLGTDASGTIGLPNGMFDVWVDYTTRTRVEGNLIAARQSFGITITGDYNVVVGNRIGTDASGEAALGHQGGVQAFSETFSLRRNRIGGAGPGEGNVIIGLVSVRGPLSDQNYISGNRIGVNGAGAPYWTSGNDSRPMISLGDGSQRGIIGGSSDAEANVIAGGGADGVVLSTGSNDNFIGRNWIGLDRSGAVAGNRNDGISSGGDSNFFLGNRISNNGRFGVFATAPANTIRANSIHHNGAGGIGLRMPKSTPAPAIATSSATAVGGKACPGCLVDVYSDAASQGAVWEGAVRADSTGAFKLSKAGGFTGPNVTATATSADGLTSPFSGPAPLRP